MSAVMDASAARVFAGATASAAWRLRGILLAGCVVSVALVAVLGSSATSPGVDMELVRLLRGMAVIKASLVVAALGVLWWRAGHAVEVRIASAYAAGVWSMAGASVAIWQLHQLVIAAGFFHAGLAALLWAAWRDDGKAVAWARSPAHARDRADPGRLRYRVARRRTASM